MKKERMETMNLSDFELLSKRCKVVMVVNNIKDTFHTYENSDKGYIEIVFPIYRENGKNDDFITYIGFNQLKNTMREKGFKNITHDSMVQFYNDNRKKILYNLIDNEYRWLCSHLNALLDISLKALNWDLFYVKRKIKPLDSRYNDELVKLINKFNE